ncbi:hypothetical protein [Cellulomonas cellasea]|uniref:Uncharacterized protein n=1 Tax=Cellulomonas cellasea TaxID=43670 RepID=A0A7W4UG99_9CELL|nr:hypothetical protein [Cellulomonas cellasea]MBB2923655.1 hypothetical protein [Cellulomonas cellasea]
MLVTLRRIGTRGEPAVGVNAPGVSGSAVWRGPGAPVVGVPVDVELDVPGPVGWDMFVVGTPSTDLPAVAEGELRLVGVVEHRDDDGVVVLRVGRSVVLVETTGTPPRRIDGQRVAVVVRGVEVHPTSV